MTGLRLPYKRYIRVGPSVLELCYTSMTAIGNVDVSRYARCCYGELVPGDALAASPRALNLTGNRQSKVLPLFSWLRISSRAS